MATKKKAAKTSGKVSKADAQCEALCRIMTSKKAKAFGRAGVAFYKEYLKYAQKHDKAIVPNIKEVIAEMSEFGKSHECHCE